MNFLKVIGDVVGELEAVGVRYALIGGFALGLRGVQRATMDLDFILMLEDMGKADAILNRFGYKRVFQSENVSHYESPDDEWGRIDILHAFRGPSLGMLKRAELISVDADVRLRVVQIEDLVGLKVQAMYNDPRRAIGDWDDIRLLLQSAGMHRLAVDWELMEDYLRLFGWQEKISEFKAIYGPVD
jgi:predicted nucleotidyltransferase